jgi:hypothetical protein
MRDEIHEAQERDGNGECEKCGDVRVHRKLENSFIFSTTNAASSRLR